MAARQVLILAGGRSCEHQVSLLSARSVLAALAGHRGLSPTVRVIGLDGRVLGEEASHAAVATLASPPGVGGSWADLPLDGCDVVLPLVHGPFGEDGTLQGLLELAQVPYVGSGVLASALAMDKAMSKRVLERAQVPQVDWLVLGARRWAEDPSAVRGHAARWPLPWFVKPANLGSSLGISRVDDADQLAPAVELALLYDRQVVVEAGVPSPRELEVAVLGNDPPEASGVGEITYQAAFYDYETKYTPGRSELHIPAKLPGAVAERARALALQVFVELGCQGMARVDFLMARGSGELWVNEVNTIPGFTPMSMYPRLWGEAGLPYPALIERLCELAIARHLAEPTRRLNPGARP